MNTRVLHASLLIAGLLTLPLLAAGCIFGSSSLQTYRDVIAKDQRDRTISLNGIALSLHPRKDVFKRNEPVLVDYRLTNVTAASSTSPIGEINVYAELVPEGFLVTFDLERLGKEKEQVHKSEVLKINPEDEPGRYCHYMKLQPGFFVGRPLQFDSRRLKPGIYKMIAYYTNLDQKECLLSPRLTPDQIRLLETEKGNEGFARLWVGKLTSNTIVFEVK